MKNHLLVYFFITITLLWGCASKELSVIVPPQDNITDNRTAYIERLKEILNKVNEKTPTICSFKNNVIFDYQDEKIKVKMKGIIQKDCFNNGEVLILGPFNVVLYQAKYQNGNLEITNDNKTIVVNDKNRAKIAEMIQYIHLLNYPGIKPDESFNYQEDGDRILFYKDNSTILAEGYAIKKILHNGLTVSYKIDGTDMKEITIVQESKNRYLRIIFN